MFRYLTFVLVLLGACSGQPPPPQGEVSFPAADGVTVFADIHAAADAGAPVLLLMHQGGGDARSEYAPLLEHLTFRPMTIVMLDLRRGGDRFGGVNRTAAQAAAEGRGEFTYCDAYADLEAAVDYLRRNGYAGPLILWGSSYTGALAAKFAQDRGGDIAGILAFSPASRLPECELGLDIAAIAAPGAVFRPSGEMELESVVAQLEAFRAAGFETHIIENGAHGSSMLVAARSPEADTEAALEIVRAFIDRVLEAG
ncbi:MAG: hypothetical protein Tsb0010_19060 [Parvularculaceae bacterium]